MQPDVSIMGVINLSPDSFYPASRSLSLGKALETAERWIDEGADILDVGAESTRPGSHPIPEELELERLVPIVSELCRKFNAPVSVDTYKPAVAEKVLSEGATIINDITGLQGHPGMAGIIARHGAGVILMHMRGTPPTMQDHPRYEDLIGEVVQYLGKSVDLGKRAGIAPERMVIDPGIGFGKTPSQNLQLVRRLDELKVLNQPILIGVSRKSFIGQLLDLPVEERLEASLAAAVIAVWQGAKYIRTHDVRATFRAVKMACAIRNHQGKTA